MIIKTSNVSRFNKTVKVQGERISFDNDGIAEVTEEVAKLVAQEKYSIFIVGKSNSIKEAKGTNKEINGKERETDKIKKLYIEIEELGSNTFTL